MDLLHLPFQIIFPWLSPCSVPWEDYVTSIDYVTQLPVLWFSIGVHYWEATADQGREERGFGMFIPHPPSLLSGPWFGSDCVPLPKAIVSARQPLQGLQLSLSHSNSSLRIRTVPSPQVLWSLASPRTSNSALTFGNRSSFNSLWEGLLLPSRTLTLSKKRMWPWIRGETVYPLQ